MKLEYKSFKFEVKAIDESTGEWEGYTSIFGNIDEGGDRVWKGAFLRSIKNRLQKFEGYFPVLFAHNYRAPAIGRAKFEEDGMGLKTYGQLFINVWQEAKGILYNMKNLVSNSLSFIYDALQYDFETVEGKRIRNLREVKVYETSILNSGFSMNEMADVTGVKNIDMDARETERRIKAMESQLAEMKGLSSDADFKQKITEDLKALQQQISELAPKKKDTFDTVELAKVSEAIQGLTDRIKYRP